MAGVHVSVQDIALSMLPSIFVQAGVQTGVQDGVQASVQGSVQAGVLVSRLTYNLDSKAK